MASSNIVSLTLVGTELWVGVGTMVFKSIMPIDPDDPNGMKVRNTGEIVIVDPLLSEVHSTTDQLIWTDISGTISAASLTLDVTF